MQASNPDYGDLALELMGTPKSLHTWESELDGTTHATRLSDYESELRAASQTEKNPSPAIPESRETHSSGR